MPLVLTHLFLIALNVFLHSHIRLIISNNLEQPKTKPTYPSNRTKLLESDNPGSTDSEVRKILTLHIPITEYDTLGSESDNDVSARALNSAKYRAQRGESSRKFHLNIPLEMKL